MKLYYAFTICVGLLPIICAPAQAQQDAANYPEKPVNLVVPASPGGPADVIARFVGMELSDALGQQVIVENKPGASQMLGTGEVARSVADGYTLLFAPSTPLVIVPFTMNDVPYDVQRDFRIVAHIGTTPLMLYANASAPVNSVDELVEAAGSQSGGLNYATWGSGSSGHLLVEYMSRQRDITLTHIPYPGIAPALTDVAAGHVQLGVSDIGTAERFVAGGTLKPIAVAGETRAPDHPDVPTFAEQGITGAEPFSPWFAVMAPAGTPDSIVEKLSAEIVSIVKEPEMTGRLTDYGLKVTALPAGEAEAFLDRELTLWSQIVSELSDISFN